VSAKNSFALADDPPAMIGTRALVFPSRAERDRLIEEYGADKGLVQTLARLGEHLATLTS
jgi:hypothetical protein